MEKNHQPSLFPCEGKYVLWGRESPRHRWRVVGSADIAAEALESMERSGIRGGDWYLADDGTNPNDTEACN